MKRGRNVMDVCAAIRATEPVGTTTLSRFMRQPYNRTKHAVRQAHEQGFIMRLPGDTRWYVVRVG